MVYEHWAFCLLAFIYVVKASTISRTRLSDSILHYDALDYDRQDLTLRHNIVRKSLTRNFGERELHLNFKAHQRTFNLRLKRDTSLFTHDLHIERDLEFHPSNVYEGYVLGEPSSLVHGFVYDGIFEGSVYTEDGNEFHIESAKQYKLDNETIHSVIYNVKDISYTLPHQCGGISARTKYNLNDNTTVWNNINENKITFEPEVHSRHRREVPKRKTECHLYVRADPTYKIYAGNSESKAMYMMSQHVKRVSHIFQKTDFDNDASRVQKEYTLNIKRIGVIDTSKCSTKPRDIQCRYKSTNIGVEKFLDIASLEDHSAYCLSYVFAHRDFSDGVLGLAWIGDTGGAGGICDPYQSIQGSMKSLNTGIVSVYNYGKNVPSKVTDITLAHELGHNFGSPHDPLSGAHKKLCAPGGSSGNYIMYPRATSGSEVNNNKFSSCSKDSIKKVLDAKANECFKVKGEPICGNRVVEDGEQCDCGYDTEASCQPENGGDKCCNGASVNGDATGCKFSTKALANHNLKPCSPSQGDCCDPDTCKPYPRSRNEKCFKGTSCAKDSFCSDKVKDYHKCPVPEAEADNNTLCNSGANTCVNGECTGSLCLTQKKKDCQCSLEADFCKVCCEEKLPTGTTNCTVYKSASASVQRPPGSPCDQYQGYCDILDKCRKVDAEGPLSRLKKWLFNPKSFDTILDWMRTHWWACVLIALGLILFMAGFIACCSVHTPSSNPAKPQHRTLRQTLSRRGRSHNRPSAPALSNSAGGRRTEPPDHPPGYHTAVRESRILPEYEMSSSYNYNR